MTPSRASLDPGAGRRRLSTDRDRSTVSRVNSWQYCVSDHLYAALRDSGLGGMPSTWAASACSVFRRGTREHEPLTPASRASTQYIPGRIDVRSIDGSDPSPTAAPRNASWCRTSSSPSTAAARKAGRQSPSRNSTPVHVIEVAGAGRDEAGRRLERCGVERTSSVNVER